MKPMAFVSCFFALWALPADKSVLATACDLIALFGSVCAIVFIKGRMP
jgi:hypothetical protein